MKNFFRLYSGVIGTLFVFALLLSPVLVMGAGVGQPSGSTGQPSGISGQPFGGSSSGSANCAPNTLCNPLGGINSVCGLVKAVLQAVMVIGIPIAILFIVWAGFQFVLAQGNGGKLETAQRNFLNVVIGIGIFVGATLIADVIINTLTNLGVQGLNSC